MTDEPDAGDPLEAAWSTLHDGLTEYLDEEARIARGLALIKEEEARLGAARRRLRQDRSDNRQRGSEIAQFWWETWGEERFGGNRSDDYEIPLDADPWIGRVGVRFEPDRATGGWRPVLSKAYGADGRPLELIRDPEIERGDGEAE